jgi:hypothetical protein
MKDSGLEGGKDRKKSLLIFMSVLLCLNLLALPLWELIKKHTQKKRRVHLMQPCKDFIYKHTIDLENVQRNKKKGKGRKLQDRRVKLAQNRCQNLPMSEEFIWSHIFKNYQFLFVLLLLVCKETVVSSAQHQCCAVL